MKLSLPALALAGLTAAAPVAAQEPPPDAARLEAMTCREFLALDAAGQATVKAAMQAHASGEPLPKSSIHASATICDGISKGESARKLITARPGSRASPVASASASESDRGVAR